VECLVKALAESVISCELQPEQHREGKNFDAVATKGQFAGPLVLSKVHMGRELESLENEAFRRCRHNRGDERSQPSWAGTMQVYRTKVWPGFDEAGS
jgi:hypothetical protein